MRWGGSQLRKGALSGGLGVALALVLTPPTAGAPEGPPGFQVETAVDGLQRAIAMEFAPDGRLFVCEQGGAVRIAKEGRLLDEPFLTLDVDSFGERGLLGLALHPRFPRQPWVYVHYTTLKGGRHNRISRWRADGDRAVPGSEEVLLELSPMGKSTHHYGGALHFGRNEELYIAVGDNAIEDNSQLLTNVFGKMLRIRADGRIPASNPFYGSTTGPSRAIWALGLRNPFTFAVQPGTDTLFINDVGRGSWEEINIGRRGANYGWPVTEGAAGDHRFRDPVYAYAHYLEPVTGCAISGGAFYSPRRRRFPRRFVGSYLFADFCKGWIRRYDPATRKSFDFLEGFEEPVDLDVTPDGDLYCLTYRGYVSRIRYEDPR
jgi:glucose/arabinose dehydrogenase